MVRASPMALELPGGIAASNVNAPKKVVISGSELDEMIDGVERAVQLGRQPRVGEVLGDVVAVPGGYATNVVGAGARLLRRRLRRSPDSDRPRGVWLGRPRSRS